MATNQVPALPKQQKGHGCFFYGCLTVIIVAILAAVGIWLAVMKIKSLAKDFTSDQPAELPMVELPAEQATAFDTKVQAFQQAMKDDTPARLVLTANEINAAFNSSPDFQKMGGRINVRIDGDQIEGAVSVPLDILQKAGAPVKMLGVEGRYFNGKAKFRVGLEAGRLLIFLDQIEANGNALPEAVMKELRSKNLAEDAMKDPETAAAIAKLKRISVENGSIIVEK